MTMDTTTDSARPAATAWPRVPVTDDLDVDAIAYLEFSARVLAEGIAHTDMRRWPTTTATLEAVLPHAIVTARWREHETALLELDGTFGSDCIAYVWVGDGGVLVRVAARDLPVVEQAERWLREQFPERGATDDRTVPVSFWSLSGPRGYAISRNVAVAPWSDIRVNYPAGVHAALDELVGMSFEASDGGKLVLWHGEPGTGKTHALRALAWEWRSWCELHYVTDPEQLFGGRASYLMDVLLSEPDDAEKWRLLVLEDTGELLAADAKERTGQGLSRLLNVVDGIIGQGLRLLLLVTTNEPLTRLHPAVARPGRCAAKIEFLPFGPGEAGAWLAEHGGAEVEGGGTLATLYARAEGRHAVTRVKVGFGA